MIERFAAQRAATRGLRKRSAGRAASASSAKGSLSPWRAVWWPACCCGRLILPWGMGT